jgi:2-polyprenyl-6-methoxyphenol hydroxylase-like FAD-dependent oxidoreductase
MNYDVIVVGAGPVGLACACELGWRGVSTLVLERRQPEQRRHPTANHISRRTMEHLRRWGVADRVRYSTFPQDHRDDRVFLTEVGGYELFRFHRPPNARAAMECWTPESEIWSPKQYFDPILEEFARSHASVDIRTGWTVAALEQSESGVVVIASSDGHNETRRLSARYLVACDGAHSSIRRALRVRCRGVLGSDSGATRVRSFFVRSNAIKSLLPGEGTQYFIVGRRNGSIIAIDGEELWRVHVRDHVDGEDANTAVQRMLGAEIPLEILSDLDWTFSIAMAERYRSGCIFLAGDAAHQSSAYGGLGANTGIGDAVDIGWKLEAVLGGWGGDMLLDSYEIERQRAMALLARYQRFDISGPKPVRLGTPIWDLPPPPPELYQPDRAGDHARRIYGNVIRAHREREYHNVGVDLGHNYEGSPVILPDGSPPPRPDITTYTQSSRPGSRAPHGWLLDGRSTLDLFGRGFVLLNFGPALPSTDLGSVAKRLGVPLSVKTIDHPELSMLYERRYALVRPDGYVAWRGDALPSDPEAVLKTVCGLAAGPAQVHRELETAGAN